MEKLVIIGRSENKNTGRNEGSWRWRRGLGLALAVVVGTTWKPGHAVASLDGLSDVSVRLVAPVEVPFVE